MTITRGMAPAGLTVVEVRCPVPEELHDGRCRPGRLLLKLRLAGGRPSYVHPDNLIELSCDDCKYRLKRAGVRVGRVLHRFDLSGDLVETLTEGGPGLGLSSPPEVGPMALSDSDRKLADLVSEMDDEEVLCRGPAGHRFPLDQRRRKGARLKGVEAVRQVDGCYLVVETCLECGMVERWSVTLPGGAYDVEMIYRYRYSRRWKKIPQDLGRLGKRQFRVIADNRAGGVFRTTVLEAARSTDREIEGVPQTRFSHG